VAAVKFRELFDHCLRRQWNTDCPKPHGLCHGTRAVTVSWAAGLLPARLRAPDGRAGGRPAYQADVWLGERETKLDLKLGALLNAAQGSLLSSHNAHTQTHTHALSVAQWAYLLGLGTVA